MNRVLIALHCPTKNASFTSWVNSNLLLRNWSMTTYVLKSGFIHGTRNWSDDASPLWELDDRKWFILKTRNRLVLESGVELVFSGSGRWFLMFFGPVWGKILTVRFRSLVRNISIVPRYVPCANGAFQYRGGGSFLWATQYNSGETSWRWLCYLNSKVW